MMKVWLKGLLEHHKPSLLHLFTETEKPETGAHGANHIVEIPQGS